MMMAVVDVSDGDGDQLMWEGSYGGGGDRPKLVIKWVQFTKKHF